jgi:hypothetical protein
MRATISRQYREGNWSIYSEDIDHHWQEFLSKVPFEFDETRESHRSYANGFIQALFGTTAQIHLEF